MWFIKALVSAFCLPLVLGLNCSNQCCYYYHGVPANVTSMPCNPDGSTITWECQVYSPHDPGTTLSVKWYRSASEVSVRDEGELIAERNNGGRYSFSVTRATSPLNDSQLIVNGLFFDLFQLTIQNYDSSMDGGYYWCQMVINGTTCLQPSDIGRIAPSSVPTRNCSFSSFDFIEFEMPQVCARRSSCTREIVTTDSETGPPITSTQMQTASSTTSVASDSNNTSGSGTMAVTFYAVIGVMAVIIAILLLVIVAFVVNTVRNHSLRVYEIKQESDRELRVVEDPRPHQLHDAHDQFTQTSGDDTDSKVVHRSERTERLPSTHPLQPGVPPPESSPPCPPTTPDPTDDDTKPPQLTNDNPKHVSRLSSNDGHYAHPIPRHPLSKSRDSAKSSPALTGITKYQDIRVSRLNYEHMYSIATNNSKANPSYVNVPNNKS